ncbi:hypothetical protein GQ457_17G019390 [Hibiscus cannabinus]
MSLPTEDLGGNLPTLSETHGGRPPELVVVPSGPMTLERQGSPLANEVQPAAKKGKGNFHIRDESDVCMNNPEDDDQMRNRHSGDHRLAQGQDGMMASFRDTLVGKAGAASATKGISELDVTVNDEDVIYGGSSKTIGYRTLLNRIHSLWNPMGELQLIDLDNDYFLVRFAEEADFVKVITGGPWVIYGSYLTVQPWSRGFSTSVTHLDKVMVWVRLPRLPYHYYTKSLFRYIANVIGRVVRIDYNTEDGKRGRFARVAVIVDLNRPLVSGIVSDGTRQDIEYEGLPSICYSCGKYGHAKENCGIETGTGNAGGELENARDPKELYGPWMQVVNRRRRPLGNRNANTGDAAGRRRVGSMGSRFVVLRTHEREAASPVRTELGGRKGHVVGREHNRSEPVDLVEDMVNGEARMDLDGQDAIVESDAALMLGREVASIEEIVVSETTLNKEKHTAMRVGSEPSGQGQTSRHGRILPVLIRGSNTKPVGKSGANFKDGQRLNLKVKQAVDRGNGKPILASRVSMLMSELDGVKQSGSTSAPTSTTQRHGPSVQWRENGAFDHPNGDQTQNRSYRIFRGYLATLGGSISVDVLAVTKQCVHARCSMAGNAGVFMLTCVYASPNRQQRAKLWSQLLILQPEANTPWVLGFIEDAGLIDMGFSGPQFTWKRGDLSQRLDRCLCNSRWYSEFVQSEVIHLQRLGSDHRPILLDTGMDSNQRKSSLFRYISAWNDHPDFINMLKDSWNDSRSIGDNISNFQSKSKEWSWTVFGHIDRRKNLLLSRIKGIEMALETGSNPYLEDLEIALKCDLEHVLEQEESLWFQRARTNWIQSGDRNTAFFHASVILRKKRNRISMLKVSDGSWCRDAQILKNHAADFFKTLFTSDLYESVSGTTLSRFPRLTGEENHRLSSFLPSETLAKIATVPPPQTDMGSDNLGWRWEDNRKFTTKSAYGALREVDELHGEAHWRQIWKMPIPQRIRMFFWLVLNERLLTNTERVRRHLSDSAYCSVCNNGSETIEHALRLCSKARRVWELLVPSGQLLLFDSIPFGAWILQGVRTVTGIGVGDELWSTTFAVTCWWIWKFRCSQIFGAVEYSSEGLARHCRAVAAEHAAAFACRQVPHAAIQVQWNCPDRGYIGRCSILMAELWAIREALRHSWERGYRFIRLETDSLSAFETVHSKDSGLEGSLIVHDVRDFLSRDWRVRFRYINRGGNAVADRLAKMS